MTSKPFYHGGTEVTEKSATGIDQGRAGGFAVAFSRFKVFPVPSGFLRVLRVSVVKSFGKRLKQQNRKAILGSETRIARRTSR